MLVQLKRRGWDVRILGATIFDSERGMTLLNPHREALRDKPVVNVTDPDGLQHTLIVTKHWATDELRNAELNTLFAHYAAFLDQFHPDLVFFYGGNAFDLLIPHEAKRRGIKSVAYLVNSNYVGGTRWCEDVDRIVTDSHATAGFYKEKVGIDLVPVGTFIEPGKVIAPTHLRKHILFVNPSLTKGAAIVAQLAWLMAQKRPDILFEVVESRGLWQPVLRSVTQALGDPRDVLPNVIVTPTQADMRPVYSRARIVLAPSLWWESGARVLAEAMLNGIPAIVTDHGGSPEMIEDGGIKLKLDPDLHQPPYQKIPKVELLAPLVERLIALYDDEALYRSYCERAAAVGRRKHDIERNTDRLIEVFEDVLSQPKSDNAKIISPPIHTPSDQLWLEICRRFPMFAPNSAGWTGGFQARAELTQRSAVGTVQALERLAESLGAGPAPVIVPLAELALNEEVAALSQRLAERFTYYGSDKTVVHRYEPLYATLLAPRQQLDSLVLLEIGLGTNNTDTPSNMGAQGKPGASVRAFRDVFPQAQVHGADVDRRILFTEERLHTHFVDQLDPATLEALGQEIGAALDLIIDDGLHMPYANLNTLIFALRHLKPGGHFVIEDILEPMLPIWRLVARLLRAQGHEAAIYRGRAAFVFVVTKVEK